MKDLLIIRHAKSSWSNPSLSDIERPLNDRGIRDAPRMAELVAKQNLMPDAIYCSPAQRTLTTASFFIHKLKLQPELLHIKDEIYNSNQNRMDQLIRSFPEKTKCAFLIGHNPTLTDWINRYAAQMIDNLPTCGIAWFEFNTTSWSSISYSNANLKKLWFPKMLS
jgi:phosphohistidine phosphatase